MKQINQFIVYGLDETYPELGEFSFKIVVSPRTYKAGEDFDLSVVDSDRKPMKFQLRRWGRKLNVVFTIDPAVSDGVSTVAVNQNGQEIGRFSFWVIKP